VKPKATYRRRGKKRDERPPSPADEDQEAAIQAAASALTNIHGITGAKARMAVQTVLIVYLTTLGARSFSNPAAKAALSAEEPWSLMRLIDKDEAEEAALAATLPIAAEIAAIIDPEGKRPFGQWGKEEVLRVFEAVVAAFLETRGEKRAKAKEAFDDEIPFG